MLEVCVDKLQAVGLAIESGAQRIELSEDLSVGGVTPSAELIKSARRQCSEALIVLVRSRAGDFHYSSEELEQMLMQARRAIELGADGVAVGACHPDRSLDWDFMARVQSVVKKASEAACLVVHRVFDQVPEPIAAIERLIELGYERILTSGGADHAADSLEVLRQWQSVAKDRLEILPAGGIHAGNAHRILHTTGCRQLHGSFTKTGRGESSPMPNGQEIAEVRQILDAYLMSAQGG